MHGLLTRDESGISKPLKATCQAIALIALELEIQLTVQRRCDMGGVGFANPLSLFTVLVVPFSCARGSVPSFICSRSQYVFLTSFSYGSSVILCRSFSYVIPCFVNTSTWCLRYHNTQLHSHIGLSPILYARFMINAGPYP